MMAVITICSDFGAQKIKSDTASTENRQAETAQLRVKSQSATSICLESELLHWSHLSAPRLKESRATDYSPPTQEEEKIPDKKTRRVLRNVF